MKNEVVLEPQPIPEPLLSLMPRKGIVRVKHPNEQDGVEFIPEGYRNDFIASIAGLMRRNGINVDGMEKALQEVNQTLCEPPLVDDEVSKIAKSISKYPAVQINGAKDLTPALYIDPSEVRLERVTASQLREEFMGGEATLERLPFLGVTEASPFIQGFSHLLSAYPKTGKTELLVRLAEEWGQAGESILWITEEPRRAWTYRISKFSYQFQNLTFMFALGTTLRSLVSEIKKSNENIVVIDTTNLLLIQNGNEPSPVNLTLTPVVAACREMESTLILVHHTRKAYGDYGAGAAGSYQFQAVVDRVLEIEREKTSLNRRRIRGWSRLDPVPEIVYELLDDGTMVALGNPKQVELSAVNDSIMEVLPEEWQSTDDVVGLLPEPKPSKDQALKSLNYLAQSGNIEREPPWERGKQPGKTYKWRKPTSYDSSI